MNVPSRDAGLQPQRTALAWNRTALAVCVNALLVLRLGEQSGAFLTTLLGVFLLVAAAAAVAAGRWRRQALESTPAPPGPPAAILAAMVGVVWLAAVAGLASILAAGVFD